MAKMFFRNDQQNELKHFIDTKEKTDILVYHHHSTGIYCKANIAEWTQQMKDYRKYVKKNELKINIKNHRNPMIQGKQFYTLVVQDTDENKNPGIDPLGMAFDDGCFLVSGYIYAFRTEENRDNSYKYIMGIK